MNNAIRIRIIEPAGCASATALERNISALQRAGFDVVFDQIARDERYPLYAASDEARARCLSLALTEVDTDVVMAARGGYGASSLLRRLDWDAIETAQPRLLIGFSDISAVHCAIYTRLRRVGLHGPMPGSVLFGEKPQDTRPLLELLSSQLPWQSAMPLNPVNASAKENIDGWLFGGNLAVVSSLIGTPWFPSKLDGAIVFIEDVNVNAGAAGRDLDQWIESGKAQGLKALIIGAFTKSGDGRAGERDTIVTELARRVSCPVFETELFGHCAPNLPIPVGGSGTIKPIAGTETWQLHWRIDRLSDTDEG